MKKIIILLLFLSFLTVYAEHEFGIAYTKGVNVSINLSSSGELIKNLHGVKLEYTYRSILSTNSNFDLGTTTDLIFGKHKYFYGNQSYQTFLYPKLLIGLSHYLGSSKFSPIIGINMLLGLSVFGDDGSKDATLGFRVYLNIPISKAPNFNSYLKLGAVLGVPVSSLFASASFIF